MSRRKTKLEQALEAGYWMHCDCFASHGESDGLHAIGEVVDVQLPTGDWCRGHITEILTGDYDDGRDAYYSVMITRHKKWEIKIEGQRRIKSRGRLLPRDQYVGLWRKPRKPARL